MSYKHTFNRDNNYLAHFNKNHSKANGQFISGDGDDDGIIDDHHHRSGNKRGVTSGSSSKNGDRYSTNDWKKGAKVAVGALGAAAAIATTVAVVASFVNKNKSNRLGDGDDFHDENLFKHWWDNHDEYSKMGYNTYGSWYANDYEPRKYASRAKVVGGDW